MAVYLVEDSKGNKNLVETRTKAGAINYVSRQEYKATSLNTNDLVKYIREGLEVETPEDAETNELVQQMADASESVLSEDDAARFTAKKLA